MKIYLPLWVKYNKIHWKYSRLTQNMYDSTHQAAGSYSAHILTYSSRWWGPSMDESLVRYSKLSMMTATNRFSICTSNNLLDISARLLFVAHSILILINNRWFFYFFFYSSYQEWTEENKGDEVEVGKLAATFRICVPWQGVAVFIPQTGQHNLMPCFSCCTPKKNTRRFLILKESGWLILQSVRGERTWREAWEPEWTSWSCYAGWWHFRRPLQLQCSQTTSKMKEQQQKNNGNYN